jgi:hypothetical protein
MRDPILRPDVARADLRARSIVPISVLILGVMTAIDLAFRLDL